MKTKKILFFTLSLFCFTFMAEAQRGVRIGYIDMEYILESVPEYREASIQLEGKVQRWKQDIEKKQKEIDQMKLNLANERVLLTKELIDEREEEIKLKEDEMLQYQQDRFGPNGDLMIQRRQLVQPIQDQVFNIVQEVAENKKYDFIFDKSADVVMLFAAKRNDISDIVLRSIERAGRRVQAADKKEKREIEKREKLSVEEEGAITEREKAIEEKKEEREKLVEAKKTEREEMMAQRQRERDSIRAVKKAEFEARRQRLIEERERRRDSIMNARQNRNNTEGTKEGEEGDGQ
ncbi:OmpH family outer membrane protein [Aequorivita sp. F47161]|jgi:Skp family chaperone for outer membrane proteins|uniref:OmpH family outer membrane protein n=1 Tax=Aequorivita vitellina TaxID=2874475 RepID=A0A9X1QVL4_9FLAO|nr:OmpH family outer membrane protein [Aequorivita vitellina]MCG2418614.1 OmpH family outer membrane protein [Aequorivita vitellina]MCZ4319243.1 OmpH family outer membrane protein [Aequorivita viscosa]